MAGAPYACALGQPARRCRPGRGRLSVGGRRKRTGRSRVGDGSWRYASGVVALAVIRAAEAMVERASRSVRPVRRAASVKGVRQAGPMPFS